MMGAFSRGTLRVVRSGCVHAAWASDYKIITLPPAGIGRYDTIRNRI